VRGKRRWPGGTSLQLLTCTGGRPMMAGGAGRGSGGSVARGGRRPERVGVEWAKIGPGAGPATRISKETTWAIKVNRA
jgi:hypothetical protein